MNAEKTRAMFHMTVSITADIAAPRERVWALLTGAERFPEWNSTVARIDGTIAEGETIRLVAAVDPDRVFTLRIRDVVDGERMTWSDGIAPVFRGVRTFQLSDAPGGGTRFAMAERFDGLMLPMIARSLPDFGPIFEAYAADLKRAAESAAVG